MVLLVGLWVPYGGHAADAAGSERENHGFTQIASGRTFGLGLKADGTVVGWGDNMNGAITVPEGLSGVSAI
ncbi:MAG: hypothetical protein K0Q63_3178, partial [Paenibacillus sp.]|nr:hypothetical protein [Paenibacillus sp.]